MRKKDLMEILAREISVAEQIYEMAMDYDSEHRPHPDIEKKLKSGETPLHKIPMPQGDNPEKQNFLEFLGSERYKEVVAKVNRYLGDKLPITLKGEEKFDSLMTLMKQASIEITRLETSHARELEQLAIKMVTEYFDIPEGSVEWDVKLTPLKDMSLGGFNKDKSKEEPTPEEISIEKDLFTDLEKLNLERAKRRLINAITQGASEKGHYSYHMVEDEIEKITGSDKIVDLYGIMMSVNDAMYWQLEDKEIESKIDRPGFNPAGTEEVEQGENGAKIVVRGVNFPVLVHECFKGFLDLMAVHGMPKTSSGEHDLDLWEKVKEHEDTIYKESWDIRIGPKIWERLMDIIPGELYGEENMKEIQLHFFQTIYELPPKEFLTFMKEAIGQSKTGVRLMSEFITSIQDRLKKEAYEESLEIFRSDLDDVSAETSDDSIRDFLAGLGIPLSGDDDDYDDDDDDGGELVPVR
jgi:hypothetical protein